MRLLHSFTQETKMPKLHYIATYVKLGFTFQRSTTEIVRLARGARWIKDPRILRGILRSAQGESGFVQVGSVGFKWNQADLVWDQISDNEFLQMLRNGFFG